MSSKSRFQRFRQVTYTTHEISSRTEDGEPIELNFYPSSVAMAGRIRQLGGDLAECLGQLTASAKEQQLAVSTKTSSYDGTEGDPGARVVEESYEPAPADDILKRASFSGAAWRRMAESVLDPGNLSLLCEIVLDSLRDEVKDQDRDEEGVLLPAVVQAFRNSVDVPTLLEMLQGWLKANSGEASGMGKLLSLKVKEAVGEVVASPNGSEDTGSSTTTPGS